MAGQPLIAGDAGDTDCVKVVVNTTIGMLGRKRLPAFSHLMCLRPYKDAVSDGIKKYGLWWDCISNYEVWRRMFYRATHHGWSLKANASGLLFVDVGANIGSCSLFMAAQGINVVAFEPHPSNLYYFTRSVEMNVKAGIFPKHRVKIYPYGCGDRDATSTIFTEVGNLGNSVVGAPVSDSSDIKRSSVNHTIRIVTLDSVLWPVPTLPPPAIPCMKMDVQGFETKALRGAARLMGAKVRGRHAWTSLSLSHFHAPRHFLLRHRRWQAWSSKFLTGTWRLKTAAHRSFARCSWSITTSPYTTTKASKLRGRCTRTTAVHGRKVTIIWPTT